MSRQVLVTGASRGIGLALVQHFLAQGDVVFGCARAESPPLQHERFQYRPVDITKTTDVDAWFKQIRQQTDRLDVLINNAGIARMLPFALTPPQTAEDVMATNFLGTFQVAHAGLRLLRKSSAGRIINFTSVAVPFRLEGEAIYAAAKSAIETLTRVMARELGPFGITCNAIGPTPIRTDLIAKVPEDKLQALIRRQAIPAWAEIADVVHVVDFLAAPASRMITGQVIYLGGAG